MILFFYCISLTTHFLVFLKAREETKRKSDERLARTASLALGRILPTVNDTFAATRGGGGGRGGRGGGDRNGSAEIVVTMDSSTEGNNAGRRR
jgi:hypothetical protein